MSIRFSPFSSHILITIHFNLSIGSLRPAVYHLRVRSVVVRTPCAARSLGTQVRILHRTQALAKKPENTCKCLAGVLEPDPTNGNSLTLQTSYTYTLLNAVATVTQGSQTRTCIYDHMGRLTSGAIPETSNVPAAYQYNTFNLLTQRTDPRGVITAYGYDSLNRLHTISYNVGSTGVAATPTITFTFGTNSTQNNNGRLLTITDGVDSETYSYNILGETTQVQKVVVRSILCRHG